MALKPTTTGKMSGAGVQQLVARVSTKKSPAKVKRDLQQGSAKRTGKEKAVTVQRGTASGGFVVYGSPAKPKHASVDEIFRAVRSLKAG